MKLFWAALLAALAAWGQTPPLYKNADAPLAQRVDDLLSRLTTPEKVSQMMNDSPAIERLGIPAYNWWSECLHGVARAGRATVFPEPIGLASTWDPGLVFRMATAISDEARAKYNEFQRRGKRSMYQGLTFWSPNINLVRDPRWGRGMETYGEDPYLTGRMAIDAGSDRFEVQSGRHGAGRLGPQGDHHRRAGDAWPDVDPEQVRGREAAGRSACDGLAAHDDSDGGADRDAGEPGRGSSLGELQHFLHAGPCGCGDCGDWSAGVRLEGRVAGRDRKSTR